MKHFGAALPCGSTAMAAIAHPRPLRVGNRRRVRRNLGPDPSGLGENRSIRR